MKLDNIELLKVRICGKTIVSVEPSMWSGEVKSLMKNQEFVSITLDGRDGTGSWRVVYSRGKECLTSSQSQAV